LLEAPHRAVASAGISLSNVTTARAAATPKLNPEGLVHPTTYSVLIICPFDYAREAVKQHIEQVIPHDVPSNVTSILDVEDWRDLVNTCDFPVLTHLALSLPDANDVLEVMQHVLRSDSKNSPTLVIIADIYQKREIADCYEALLDAGRKVFIVPKPVKPSAFSKIFDPNNKRDLSKDRNQDMAREVNNNFKTMSKIVKEVIGNKGYRVLLVEDDETNRTVCPATSAVLGFFTHQFCNRSC